MNKRQRLILILSAAAIAGMLIYPPFHLMGQGQGYGWIFSPPHEAAIINAAQLLLQWAAVILVGCIMFMLTNNNKSSVDYVVDQKSSETVMPDVVFRTAIFALRLIRGFAGLIGCLQLIGILHTLSLVGNYGSDVDFGKLVAISLLTLLVAAVCFGLFFGLRSIINKLYFRRHGVRHPSLVNLWGL